MKKNEIIELNGTEYTLELNRQSFLQIDKLCNIDKSFEIMHRGFYKYMDNVEIDDNFDIDSISEDISDDSIEKEAKLKEDILKKVVERAFLIWLNPNHHLNITQVREILKPYFENEDKAKYLFEKYGQYLQECYQIREDYNAQVKNLKAQANK